MRIHSALVLAAAATGCALSPVMPPISRSYVQPGGAPATAAPASELATSPIVREYDPGENVTRVSVTTHRGQYFLWAQKPRLTFFFVHAGQAPTTRPEVMYLVFRTQTPQAVLDNHLQLTCDGATRMADGLPTSRVVPGILASSHYLTFEIPLATYLALGRCGTAEVQVGGVRAPFGADQVALLGLLARELPTVTP
ncbi:MAG: hypothetical protein IPO73_05445 [Gemmatimonadetes bacterium]|nr:hypothetical protein [Gemmatimonadota bacterium]